MKIFWFIIYLFLFSILGFALYLLYLNLPSETINFIPTVEKNLPFQPVEESNEEIKFESSRQFFKNLRFKDKRISYEINPVCGEEKEEQVLRAFGIIQEKTVLSFYKSSSPEIEITCSELAPTPEQKDHFVAGEGGPTEILNTSLYAVILKGKISLFRNEKCDNPNIALHEVLHVLGFDHNNNPNSILFPTLNCKQTIDEWIIKEINSLYTVESLPDLKIETVKASKSGRYLNFDISVVNQGLQDVENVLLGIFEDGERVKDFSLEKISIGAKKVLTVENLKISRSDKKLSFIVDYKNQIREISEKNNEIELVLQN